MLDVSNVDELNVSPATAESLRIGMSVLCLCMNLTKVPES
jgi:hypothetical protein